MDKKDWKKVILLFLLVLFIGLVVDGIKNASVIQESLYRQEPGGKGTEEEFQIVIEGLDSSLDYIIDVEAMSPTREQAEEYFVKAMQEIDLDNSSKSKSISCMAFTKYSSACSLVGLIASTSII